MSKPRYNYPEFSDIIKRIKSVIYSGFEPNLIYVKDEGFIVRIKVNVKNQQLIDSGKAFIVNNYGVGVKTAYIVEDCKEFIDGMTSND